MQVSTWDQIAFLFPCDVDQYYNRQFNIIIQRLYESRQHQADFCRDVLAQKPGLYQAAKFV